MWAGGAKAPKRLGAVYGGSLGFGQSMRRVRSSRGACRLGWWICGGCEYRPRNKPLIAELLKRSNPGSCICARIGGSQKLSFLGPGAYAPSRGICAKPVHMHARHKKRRISKLNTVESWRQLAPTGGVDGHAERGNI